METKHVFTVVVLFFACSLNSWAGPPRRISIGSGSGYLSHPDAQAALNLQPGDTLYINPGVYSGLSLGNLSGTPASPIAVKCDPQAVFTTTTPQSNTFSNVANVRFEDFRFEALAENLGMSPRNFIRRFKAATGLKPVEYLQKLRVRAARHYLEEGDARVEEIGDRVGYDDAPFFRRVFKRETGLTPSSYRKQFSTRASEGGPR